MISTDREPINQQARKQLSKGFPDRARTVEEGLEKVWQFLSSPEGAERARKAIEGGAEQVEWRIKVYKRPGPGFCVRVYYRVVAYETNPIHFTDIL